MNTQEQALLKKHDLKNYMYAAHSYLDLFIHENPQHISNQHIISTKCILNSSYEKANEIHLLFKDILKTACPDHFESVNIQSMLRDTAPAFYCKLRSIYPIEIVDSYDIIGEPRYSLISTHETMAAEENIFSNAYKAGATRITVHHHMKEEFMVSTYTDNGRGMTQDEIDMFMAARTGDGVSRGIGSRNIMRCAVNHKTPLTITSEKDKGTTIRIVLPYTE